MHNQRTPETVRDKIDALTNEIADITPVKVMSNPMMIQQHAIRTLGIMAEIVILIEQLEPYSDEVQGCG